MEALNTQKIQVLIQLAWSDGEFNDDEKEAIRSKGLEYGLTSENLDQAFAIPDDQAQLEDISTSEKLDFLIDCMEIILADHEIHEDEDRFMRTLAMKLGFREKVITFLQDYHTMERTPLSEMMSKYLI
jgi:uncharacterized tellurite resistance protein B-like protein